MHGNGITGAIAALASQLEHALVDGHDTRALRHEMSKLEQQQRAEVAAAAAKEREARAEREAEEQASIQAKAAAMASEARARIEQRIAALTLPPAMSVRRFPDGSIKIDEED